MQSEQETVIEEFMQKSFGAQFLYIPLKYMRGDAPKEPADLAWVADDAVILFYLQSSKNSLAKQTSHNHKQAAGYHRLWSTKNPKFALRGSNRFGDQCFVPYDKVRSYLTILVVSEECGVHFSTPITDKIPNAVIVIPEIFLHWIADFGGTIVDFLILVDTGLSLTNQKDDSTTEGAFNELSAAVTKYVTAAFTRADPKKRYLSGSAAHNFCFLKDQLSCMRVRANSSGLTAEGRRQIAGVFGDLMLAEYASLAAGAEFAIVASQPPKIKKFVVVKLEGLYYSFVIGTIKLGSKTAMAANDAMMTAAKNKEGLVTSISIIYGDVLSSNDYRIPLIIDIPPVLPEKHHRLLINAIMNRHANHPSNQINHYVY